MYVIELISHMPSTHSELHRCLGKHMFVGCILLVLWMFGKVLVTHCSFGLLELFSFLKERKTPVVHGFPISGCQTFDKNEVIYDEIVVFSMSKILYILSYLIIIYHVHISSALSCFS